MRLSAVASVGYCATAKADIGYQSNPDRYPIGDGHVHSLAHSAFYGHAHSQPHATT